MPRKFSLAVLLAGSAALLLAVALRMADPPLLQALRLSDQSQGGAGIARGLETLLVLATGAGVTAYFALLAPAAARRALLVGLLIIAGTTWSAHTRGIGLDPLFPALALGFTTLVAALAFRFVRARAEADLRRTFAASLSRTHLAELPDAAITDAPRHVTILHAVMADLSDGNAIDLGHFRRVMGTFAGRLREAGAHVTFAIDGSLTALWNAPLDQPAHAALAGRAALSLRPLAESLAASLSQGLERPSFRLGMGIATGAASTGRIGSAARPDYLVLGPPAQEARRLQQESLARNMAILIDAATARAAPELATLRLAPDTLILMGDEVVARAREFRALKPLLAELEANTKIHAEKDVAVLLDELGKRPWPALWPPRDPLIAYYKANSG